MPVQHINREMFEEGLLLWIPQLSAPEVTNAGGESGLDDASETEAGQVT